MKEIVLVTAMDRNRCIGEDNKLPWNLPGDRKMFAKRTEGETVVMGRKTYESIVKMLGTPLQGRTNIVLTRQKGYAAPFQNVFVVSSWDEAMEHAGGAEQIFVVGGEEIYRLALPYAERIIITHVDATVAGDAFFPELNENEWRRIYLDGEGFRKKDPRDEYAYQIAWYMRKPKLHAVDMDNARLHEQRAVMEKAALAGECPFCLENIRLGIYHKQPILKEGVYWLLTQNQYPYDNTKTHLLLILKTHAERLSELSPEALAETSWLLRWAEREYGAQGGAVCMRFGDTEFSAGTVRHIHMQFIVPDTKKHGYAPVRFKIGKDKS